MPSKSSLPLSLKREDVRGRQRVMLFRPKKKPYSSFNVWSRKDVCLVICTQLQIRLSTPTHTLTHTYTHTFYSHTNTHIHKHTQWHTYSHTHTHNTRARALRHTHIHTHKHINTQTHFIDAPTLQQAWLKGSIYRFMHYLYTDVCIWFMHMHKSAEKTMINFTSINQSIGQIIK